MTASYYEDDQVTLYRGDALDVLRGLPDGSVESVVTDPPYGISFMGKQWDQPGQYGSQRRGGSDRPFTSGAVGVDHKNTTERSASMHAGKYDLSAPAMLTFQQWCAAWATECVRVLKPGGHLLAFGGTRTWHRLAVAVEGAGFDVRDSIAWMYGSGFPKSLDVSKAIDKAAGAERTSLGIVKGAASSNTESLGVFAPEYAATVPATLDAEQWQGWSTALKPAFEPIVVARKPLAGTVAANVLAYGTGALNIDGCRVGDEIRHAAYTSLAPAHGNRLGAPGTAEARRGTQGEPKEYVGRWPANVVLDESQAAALDEQSGTLTSGANPTRRGSDKFRHTYGDFAGQDECIPARGTDSGGASRFFYTAKADAGERVKVNGVAHPTVKPLDLMRWLVRLVTPPGGTVLEPFAGSGTTIEAALLEGFKCIGIEREADYLPLIESRIARRRDPVRAIELAGGDGGLFDLLDGGTP